MGTKRKSRTRQSTVFLTILKRDDDRRVDIA
jgi:hypothetical protein